MIETLCKWNLKMNCIFFWPLSWTSDSLATESLLMCKSDFPSALQWETRTHHVLVRGEGDLHFSKSAFKYCPSRSFRVSRQVMEAAARTWSRHQLHPSLNPLPHSQSWANKGMNEPRNNSCPGRISRLQNASQVGKN